MHEPVAVVVLSLALIAVVVLTGLLMSRRRTLARRVGSFICVWSPSKVPAARAPGIAQYATGRLEWWRLVSLSPRPSETWDRDRLELIEWEELDEVDAMGRSLVVTQCRHGEESFALTMSSAAYAGLVSWLESRPRRARAL
ncbi:DUF2550 domain-containing protein [Actinotalea sp. M2MS4P-6]|uniref:DUF2550 domain-containing protein n=1 Tax=Actinotalea sp. M2MS4P-6 TaxID=2983762 RepID=UPI0021E487E2|nr:DUF2550 domain-containing protein [Actinotalea sp. M2MS4P-6]MCV2394079.1 DUF2550 domain-containing protein [Actinotalea sp. M2MS4P-6]